MMQTKPTGLEVTLQLLNDTSKPLIVADLLTGPKSLCTMYQLLPVQTPSQFVWRVMTLWRQGVVSVGICRAHGVYCRLTGLGRSLQDVISSMSQWGEHQSSKKR
ncbi:winged helix-turn-helix transcriptional regulator [Furfurilactobacillus siliginis]|uniref:HTH hxlR-type domain-containing protein n=1 Tax=Furfurilactobacillus siliginis TaxID=348151 RepID=A0A0R2LC40_9LACO|nr:winged helix-turn-helix transcriptional regulator [Furfurilactobacillus siliginis]KRN97302.1 hypothetical protein IV55_GL000230 [Furfurilactobacillus siliginis]GEK28614.1 hypothetical protein LSI01_09250 [Furfurilactobacillus siliginis]